MKITKEAFDLYVARELDYQDNFQNEDWGGENHSDEKWVAMLLAGLGGASECVLEESGGGLLEQIIRMAGMLQAWVTSRDFDSEGGAEFELIRKNLLENRE